MSDDALPLPRRLSRTPRQVRGDLAHEDVTYAFIGGSYDVHGSLGEGFLERVYANALTIALTAAGLRVEREVPFVVRYRGHDVGRYIADLVVEAKVIVEVEAADRINDSHKAQLLNYLRASGLEVGLVLNFGRSAEFKRLVCTPRPRR